jgi:hypothetical protein
MPEDPWRNVKIPRFESLNSSADEDGWKAVPTGVAADDYSSLLGIPVASRQRLGDMAFSLEST